MPVPTGCRDLWGGIAQIDGRLDRLLKTARPDLDSVRH